jgi:hypothetical protein
MQTAIKVQSYPEIRHKVEKTCSALYPQGLMEKGGDYY